MKRDIHFKRGKTLSLDKVQVLFFDECYSNNIIRSHNEKILRKHGFADSGMPSRSGELYIEEKKFKVNVVFGLRANSSSKGMRGNNSSFSKTIYFSLAKEFETYEEAMIFMRPVLRELKRR